MGQLENSASELPPSWPCVVTEGNLGFFSQSGQTSNAEKVPRATSPFPPHGLTCAFLRYTDTWKRGLLRGCQTDKPRESLWAENTTEAR